MVTSADGPLPVGLTAVVELLRFLPWDDALRGIAADVEDSPSFAWVDPQRNRKTRAPVRIRVDAGNGLHLLGVAREIVHLDARGDITGRTPLSTAPGGRIVDYACDVSRQCTVLENIGGAGQQVNRLRRVNDDGSDGWSRSGPSSTGESGFAAMAGNFSKLLLDETNQRLYMQAKHDPLVAELNADTGAVEGTIRLPEGLGTAFLAEGRLGGVFLNPEGTLRGTWLLDPKRGEAVEWPGTPEHFAWLVYPFGLDDAHRIYVWRDGRIGRISPDGTIEEIFAISGVAVRASDRAVFTSRAASGVVRIDGPGVELELPAPADHRLMAVDADGRYHLVGPATPAADGRRLLFSADGGPEPDGPMPEQSTIECRLSPYDLWQVDGTGRVVLSATTPDGFAVLRLTPG